MLARFCVVLSLLLTADSTLPNGIRLSDFAASGDRVEIIAGYQAGIRNEKGLSGLASIVGHFWASTPAARALAVTTYGAGGQIEFLNELDRTAVRVTLPEWAAPMIFEQLPALLAASPDQEPDLVERARGAVLSIAGESNGAFRSKVEDEIRVGLLGSHPYHHPPDGWKFDVEQISNDDVLRFFNENYGTDHAFIASTIAIPDDVRRRLSEIPQRSSRKITAATLRVINGERILKFESAENAGAVIFASPVGGVFYRAWYSVLVLDRLAHRSIPGKLATSFVPAMDPYYWRLELPVPSGQFAEAVQENLLQEINRMQFTRAKPEDMESARKEAVDYLNSPYIRGWFASLGSESHRQEGLQWVQSFTVDDMRATARDLVIMNRLIAEWSPKPTQNVVRVESLNSGSSPVQSASTLMSRPLPPVQIEPLPNHPHPAKIFLTPEHLSSGVWLATSNVAKVFVSGGERPDSNGAFWDLNAESMRALQKYRADRILVLVPAATINATRTTWSSFKGNDRDATVITPQGKVANIDLPALLILKSVLDRRLIEAGWWRDAALRIDATHGAALQIEGPTEIRDKVKEWIKQIAESPLSTADFAWAREAAAHHLDEVLPDLQAIIWQRVPDYILPDVNSVTATQVQDIAKLYF